MHAKLSVFFMILAFRDSVIPAQMSFTQQSGIASIPVLMENARENLEMQIVKMKNGPVPTGNMR